MTWPARIGIALRRLADWFDPCDAHVIEALARRGWPMPAVLAQVRRPITLPAGVRLVGTAGSSETCSSGAR